MSRFISLLLALSLPVSAADLVFTGSLERVRNGSISVRLADGRLIDAVLPKTAEFTPAAIAAHYNLADQVETACKPIKTVYDTEAALHLHLELKNLRLLRPASRQELADVVAFLSWQWGENLLKHPDTLASGAQTGLEHVRQVNLEYASKLPNFVADEVAQRYTSDIASQQWYPYDTVESEITVKGGDVTHDRIRKDGKLWSRSFADLPGPHWALAFGAGLKPLFDPKCRNTIDFDGHSGIPGKQLLVYRFAAPPHGCFTNFSDGRKQYNPARRGRIIVEDPGGRMIRYEVEASGFPAKFGMDRGTKTEAWDYVKIGDAAYLLPVAAEWVFRSSDGSMQRVTVEYKNHRHFEAATNVTFH